MSEIDATLERFAQVIGSQLEKIQKDFPLTQHDYRRIALAYIGTQKANQEFMKDLRSLFDQYKAAMGSYRSIKKKTKQDIENVRFIARKVSQYLYHSKQNARLVSENQSEYNEIKNTAGQYETELLKDLMKQG